MRLIFIDMDGTLLDDDQKISKENIESIKKAQEEGHIVVISSGRSYEDTGFLLRTAGIDCPYITGNGAVTSYNGAIISKFLLPLETLNEIVNFLNQEEIYYELYTKKGLLFLPHGKDILEREITLMSESGNFDIKHAYDEIEVQFKQFGWNYGQSEDFLNLNDLEIYKIFVYSFNPATLEKVRKKFESNPEITTTTSGAGKFEIAQSDASKGAALKHLADYLNIALEDTIAIGDSFNDLSMFDVASLSIAMGNADERVKKFADKITLKNIENGVAYALEHIVS